MTDKPLSAPQEAFARGVASGLSQAEAYRQAYPRSRKWKAEAVHQQASRLMALPQVSSRVKELRDAAAALAVLDAAGLMRQIHMLAHSDIAGIMHADGRVKLPHELDESTRAAVASFEIDQFGKIKYKFWDKRGALDMGAKIRGLYELDNKQKTDPLADLLKGLKGNVLGPVAEEGGTP